MKREPVRVLSWPSAAHDFVLVHTPLETRHQQTYPKPYHVVSVPKLVCLWIAHGAQAFAHWLS